MKPGQCFGGTRLFSTKDTKKNFEGEETMNDLSWRQEEKMENSKSKTMLSAQRINSKNERRHQETRDEKDHMVRLIMK